MGLVKTRDELNEISGKIIEFSIKVHKLSDQECLKELMKYA